MCPLSERGCRHPLLFAVLDLLVLLDQAKSTRKESVRRKLFERSFAMRKLLCASRNDDYSVASVPGRPSTRPIALLPLLFAVLDLLVLLDQAKSTRKTEKGENFPIDSSGRIPRFRRCIRRPFSFPDFSQGGAMGALRSHCLRYFSYL